MPWIMYVGKILANKIFEKYIKATFVSNLKTHFNFCFHLTIYHQDTKNIKKLQYQCSQQLKLVF